jgi:hypothetical protein
VGIVELGVGEDAEGASWAADLLDRPVGAHHERRRVAGARDVDADAGVVVQGSRRAQAAVQKRSSGSWRSMASLRPERISEGRSLLMVTARMV